MSVADAAVERDSTPESLRARADIAKARGDRERALTDFETLAATVDDASVRLELAKIYEHWLRSPAGALRWVEQGTGETREGTKRRSERLMRKNLSHPAATNDASSTSSAASMSALPTTRAGATRRTFP